MANVTIGYGNLVDAATFSTGIGSWSTAAPLANIKNPVVAVAARTTDATAVNTKFEVNLGSAKGAAVAMLSGVNLTASATVRIRGGSVSGMASGVLYDLGTVNVWPSGTTNDILALHPRWTPAFVFPLTSAQYWLFEFTDTGNPAGYVQVGRLFLGPSFRPAINATYGARVRWINRNVRDETPSGVIYTSKRLAQREAVFTFDGLSRTEALASIAQVQLVAAASTDVALVFDADAQDTTRLQESFLGEVHEFDPSTYAAPGRFASGFSIKERL